MPSSPVPCCYGDGNHYKLWPHLLRLVKWRIISFQPIVWKWDELSDVVTMISSDSAMILVKNYTYLPICRYFMISPSKSCSSRQEKVTHTAGTCWQAAKSLKVWSTRMAKIRESGILTSRYGGFLKWRYPNSWMVKTKLFLVEHLIKMNDFGVPMGTPPF